MSESPKSSLLETQIAVGMGNTPGYLCDLRGLV